MRARRWVERVDRPDLVLSMTGADMAGWANRAYRRSRRRAIPVAFWSAAAMIPLLSGCAVVSAVSTVATVAVGVVSTAVDVGVGAVKVTGKLIGKSVEVVTGSGPSAPPDVSKLPPPAPS
jgi:hypothetical protein